MKKQMTKLALVVACLITVPGMLHAQQKIKDGTVTGSSVLPNASAVLELESNTRGFLPPRATDAQMNAIITPATGLVIYNTDSSCLYQRTATAWKSLCSSALAVDWHITGNAGTNPGTALVGSAADGNYWGTSDVQNLVVGTNNVKRALFDQSGNLMGGSNSAVIGGGNALVWGLNNSDSAANSLVGGSGNKLGPAATAALVTGFNNKAYGREGITAGRNNINFGLEAVVFGDTNKDSAGYNLVSGGGNSIASTATHTIVGGTTNRLSNSSGSIVVGTNNTVASPTTFKSGAVFGANHRDSSRFSIVAGFYDTVAATVISNAVFGQYNKITGFGGNICGGGISNFSTAGGNTVSGYNNFVEGSKNTAGSNNSIINGENNTLNAGADNAVLVGSNNMVSGANTSVSGTGNVVANSSAYDLLAGTSNADSSGHASAANFITGAGNHIGQGNTYSVWLGGYQNAISGQSHRTVVFGNSNNISNCVDAYVFGSGINLSSAGGFYTNTVNALGNVNYGGALVATSDRRFKSNFKTLGYGLNTVMQMQPQEYDQLDAYRVVDGKPVTTDNGYTGSHHSMGFIAQDLYNLVPEAVSKPKDENKEKWGVDYVRLVPVLVKAIQDQQAQIEALKQEVSGLKKDLHITH